MLRPRISRHWFFGEGPKDYALGAQYCGVVSLQAHVGYPRRDHHPAVTASEVQIWKDVSGVQTTDPRVVLSARLVAWLCPRYICQFQKDFLQSDMRWKIG